MKQDKVAIKNNEFRTAKKRYWNAYTEWLHEIINALDGMGELPVRDGTDYDSVCIYTQNPGHTYIYAVEVDKVKVKTNAEGYKHIAFHIKDGDGLFQDDTWVTENFFTDEAWEELVDYIEFPEDEKDWKKMKEEENKNKTI